MQWSGYWNIVERVVRARGRKLVKYPYFERVWEALQGYSEPRLTIVKAPTASGKTEAIVTPFLYHLLAPPRPWLSLVYALPTRSLVFTMAHRLSAALTACRIWPSTVTVNYGELLAFSPFLEGDIATSTYDTLLYAFYGAHAPSYHILLPASKVAGSLVVFDEVQLLQDTFWFGLSILPHHVASLLRFGSDVVVMSATMPSVLKDNLVEKARGLARADVAEIESRDPPERGKLEVEVQEGCLPKNEAIVDLIRRMVVDEGLSPALVVVNTVEKAASIFKRLLESQLRIRPFLLHSRLRREARSTVEELFEGSERGGLGEDGVVIIATQVVEAGLDLNVKLLLTELSPIDSLIQRLGRCARKSDGLAVIFSDPDGGRYIYPEPLLQRTFGLLRSAEVDLRRSVESIEVAQALVDEVYTKDVVERLRGSVSNIIDEVTKLISYTVPLSLFLVSAHEEVRESPLLRLGVELQCLYVAGNRYQELMEGSSVRLTMDEVTRDTVTLSLSGSELPTCLVHEVRGERKTIMLTLKCIEGEVELTPHARPATGSMLDYAAQNVLFLLNPAYYEFYEGHEVGVVRLHASARVQGHLQ